MNRLPYYIIPICSMLFLGCSENQNSNHGHSPYAGQESREIKALTAQEVEGYLNGLGMGLSKVAELNKYPGPRHVLELSDELGLSEQQREQSSALFDLMKKEAVDIGKTYIAKERRLNMLFESGEVTSSTVDSLLIDIGKIKGGLRAVHVKTHIKMKEILTPDQIRKYDRLRGYEKGTATRTHDHS